MAEHLWLHTACLRKRSSSPSSVCARRRLQRAGLEELRGLAAHESGSESQCCHGGCLTVLSHDVLFNTSSQECWEILKGSVCWEHRRSRERLQGEVRTRVRREQSPEIFLSKAFKESHFCHLCMCGCLIGVRLSLGAEE